MAKQLADWKNKHDAKTVIANLRAEVKNLQSQAATAEAIREWVGLAKTGVTQLVLPKWVDAVVDVDLPGVPTLHLSDLHWGEQVRPEQIGGVNEFNLKIAQRRLQRTFIKAVTLAKILDPTMKYPGIVCPLGGDMVSGNIHDELAATNEINTMPTVLDLYKHLVVGIRFLADNFGHVLLPCVTGNHDRDTKKIWSKDRHHTSFSWLLYQFLAVAFADDPRVQFYIPDGSDALYRIYDIRYNETHGDQFRGGDGIIGPLGPITRGDQKKLAARQATGEDYDVLVFGHFHQRIITPRLRGNSSLKGYDEYARQNNFRFEPPSQNFWMTHKEYGITFDAPIYSEKVIKRPSGVNWASVFNQ